MRSLLTIAACLCLSACEMGTEPYTGGAGLPVDASGTADALVQGDAAPDAADGQDGGTDAALTCDPFCCVVCTATGSCWESPTESKCEPKTDLDCQGSAGCADFGLCWYNPNGAYCWQNPNG